MTSKKETKSKPTEAAKKESNPEVGEQAGNGENVAKKASPEGKAAKKSHPKYLDKGITEFVVGTKDYIEMVKKHNELFKTYHLPNRVRPAVLMDIYLKMRKHYKLDT